MAVVFNIQRFCVHDGPGIRTTVFLKGCNLRCRWCHNPESISPLPVMQYFEEKCFNCGMCSTQCKNGVYANRRRLNSELCLSCGACANYCMNDALKLTGREMSVAEVMDIVRKDKIYYDNSGGGLTLSGGEPLLQADFCRELFAAAQAEGIHTALDTAGNMPYSVFQKVLPFTDAVLLDLKIMDDELHKHYTGASNALIHKNAHRLFSESVDIYIRIPVMAGVNDNISNMAAVARLIRGANNVKEVKLLPYHGMGGDKARSIGETQEEFTAPSPEALAKLAAAFDGCAPVKYN